MDQYGDWLWLGLLLLWHQFGRRLVVPNGRKARKQLVTMCLIGFWKFWQKHATRSTCKRSTT